MNRFFGSSWAYDLVKPGTFHLVRQIEKLPVLQRDYLSMRGVYLNQPVRLDDILAILSDLEHQINLARKSGPCVCARYL